MPHLLREVLDVCACGKLEARVGVAQVVPSNPTKLRTLQGLPEDPVHSPAVIGRVSAHCHDAATAEPEPSTTWTGTAVAIHDFLDQVVVFNADHVRRLLASYFQYYHRWRTHLSLAMDCPEPRPVLPPDRGSVVEIPEVGGLHHHYERIAA
jgi:hypothetical protein